MYPFSHFFITIILQATNEEGIKAVKPFCTNVIQPCDDKGQTKLKEKQNQMDHARFMNTIAKVVFIILLVIFNVVFWTIAYLEHIRTVEFYINNTDTN